jgi:glycosyltransferase involved in cell wall biosynthesis
MDCIKKSKFMLLPNLEEASPRVLTENLSADNPILVYENILGGWKYVNNNTGEFFNEHNIKGQTEKLLRNIENNQYEPRNDYVNNYGINASGEKFKDFLKSIYPDLSPCKYVKLKIYYNNNIVLNESNIIIFGNTHIGNDT